MHEVVQPHRCADLHQSLRDPLQFKLCSTNVPLISQFPHVFEYGNSDINAVVDTFLEHSVIGASETSTVILDGAWLDIIKRCVEGSRILQNQHDQSSMIRLRPDTVVEVNNAIALKGEAKYNECELENASEELVDKLHLKAVRVFPRGCNTIVGVASSIQSIKMLLISYDPEHQTYSADTFRSYNVSLLDGRVRFVVDLFKVIRWMCAIVGSNSAFHLRPGIRTRTNNGHYVTWNAEGIYKEYHHSDDKKEQMGYIHDVYTHHPPLKHVEYGRVVPNTQSCVITRIGNKLVTALSTRMVTKDQIVEQVLLGLEELHSIGLAHCDVSVKNVFVDDDGVVFLDDLEYLTPTGKEPKLKNRLPYGVDPNTVTTAEQLDEQQYISFCAEIQHM
jgi:hypothetical protein